MMTVAVIGAGKMGLPLACRIASRGANVIACDVSQAICDSINSGICPFDEPGLDDVLRRAVSKGALRATQDTAEAVSQSSVIIVIVPVLLTDRSEADTSIIEEVTRDIARGLQKGSMISYETTLPVGTTRSLVPLLESSGLKAGDDFDVVFSPERVKSQLVLERLAENPKVVGGITPAAAKRAEQFYGKYLGAPVINVGSLEASEFVKLAGMVYRDVNIALANELARYATSIGVNIDEIIAAANTDGEAAILNPGIGVGGHCTPVYPYFLINDSNRRGVSSELARASRRVNDSQPLYAIDQIEKCWGFVKGRDVLILGLAFRPQVKESICSQAFQLRDELTRRGANVYLKDPLWTDKELCKLGFASWTGKQLPPVVILNTAHQEFRELKLAALALRGCEIMIDGRNMFSQEEINSDHNLIYIGIGRRPSRDSEYISTLRCVQSCEKEPPTERIPIIRPLLGSEESQATASVISSGWIMQGPRVEQLEHEFASYASSKFACAVSSGTAALHLALLAAGVEAGDEVITVSHSYIATANSVRMCNAVPVFVDIEPEMYNIDVSRIAEAISEKTKAILCVHQMGMPCDLSALMALARRRELRVIEDAACAVGTEVLLNGQWQKIGQPYADIACFSFHPRKLLTTGDGGMITTADAQLDSICRVLRNHGLSGSQYDRLGYNYRLTDVQAAIGLSQLQKLPAMIHKRREQAALYKQLLAGIQGLQLPKEPDWARSNWQSFCVTFRSKDERDRVAHLLDKAGIDTRAGIMCAHREEAYRKEPWRCGKESTQSSPTMASEVLRESERAQDCGLILPLFDELKEQQMVRITSLIKQTQAAPLA